MVRYAAYLILDQVQTHRRLRLPLLRNFHLRQDRPLAQLLFLHGLKELTRLAVHRLAAGAAHVARAAAVLAVHVECELYFLAVLQRPQPVLFRHDFRLVDEDILAAAVRHDKAEALIK